MTLSPDTRNILKNFSEINKSVLIEPGNVIRTVSPGKNTLAAAKLADKFPVQVAIYDLSAFLSTVSLFKEPQFDFEEKYVLLHEEGRKTRVRFYYAEPDMLLTPSEKMVKASSNMEKDYKPEVTVELSQNVLEEVKKGARILQLPEFAISSDGKVITVVALQSKTEGSSDAYSKNSYSVEIGEGNGTPFHMVFLVENLKLLEGSYKVKISSKGVSKFVHEAVDLNYFIALEREKSSYDGSEGL